MDAIWGVAIIVVTAVCLVALMRVYRAPRPPSWAANDSLVAVFSIAITGFFGLGAAMFTQGFPLLSDPAKALLVVCIAVAAIGLVAVRRRGRALPNFDGTMPTAPFNPGAPANDPHPARSRKAA